MTREIWAQKDRLWKEQVLRAVLKQHTAEQISMMADTSFAALSLSVQELVRRACPHGEYISPFEDDRIEWYKAAADARNK